MNIPSRRILHPIAAAAGMLLAITVGNAHEIESVPGPISVSPKLIANSGFQNNSDAIALRANLALQSTITLESNFGPAAYKFAMLHGETRPNADPGISRTCGHCHGSH